MQIPTIYYLCDNVKNVHGCLAKHNGKCHMGKGHCGGECKYTSLLMYAKNFIQIPTAYELATKFERKGGYYYELESGRQN